MLQSWNSLRVSDIRSVNYVTADKKYPKYQITIAHRLMLNDPSCNRKLHFDDGSCLQTGPCEVRYIPEWSGFRVEPGINDTGACWMITFGMQEELGLEPFSIPVRNYKAMLRRFKEAYRAAHDGQFKQIVVTKCIYGIVQQMLEEEAQGYVSRQKVQKLEPAVRAIHESFADSNQMTSAALAERCAVSEAYFRELFKFVYSLSPKEYIIYVRMAHAKQLLLESKYSVQEIGPMCGYDDPCHFSREFSRHEGMSPREYRRTAMQNP